NVRILSATHKDLNNEIDEGRFRQDLFYRINVIELKVPALRERVEDIPLLAETMLKRVADECDIPNARLSTDAINALKQYSFPGNVRELENIIERAFTLCEDDVIHADDLHLQDNSSDARQTIDSAPAQQRNGVNLEEYLETIEKQTIEQALEETRWNKTAAAKKLGISFRALRYRLKKLGME
ncbi:MAG: sigma 54-interacting transcriptional regulator, partial [Pseudomonadales bacterium]|nr:sigma 54-interacting transcriptional regulator [Pseudomonadales bacterium]